MNRSLVQVAFLVVLALTLSACSMFIPPETRLMFGMVPSNELGYEVDDTGKITIETRSLQFTNPAGRALSVVTGYRIQYHDQNDALVGETSSEPQSLNVTVPAGFQCSAPVEGTGCSATSEGAHPAPGIPATTAALSSQLLSADIAQMHVLAGTPTGWYADITFFGHSANGQFEETYRVNIVAPN